MPCPPHCHHPHHKLCLIPWTHLPRWCLAAPWLRPCHCLIPARWLHLGPPQHQCNTVSWIPWLHPRHPDPLLHLSLTALQLRLGSTPWSLITYVLLRTSGPLAAPQFSTRLAPPGSSFPLFLPSGVTMFCPASVITSSTEASGFVLDFLAFQCRPQGSTQEVYQGSTLAPPSLISDPHLPHSSPKPPPPYPRTLLEWALMSGLSCFIMFLFVFLYFHAVYFL